MSPLRRKIADRLVSAQHTAAILTTFNEADLSNLIALRTEVQSTFQAQHGVKLGFMSFFLQAADDPIRLRSSRVWIVDPLDGTREFSELGRADWAVHVALWSDGELIAGAVALPAQGVTLATPRVPALPPPPAVPRIVVSRTRPPAVALRVRDELGGTLVEMGSAGAKVAAVVQGRAEVYVHAGGQYEWDSAAPVAVARAAGLHTSRIDGSELRYNQADLLLPDLLVCRPEFAEAALAVLR
jgi:3'(2'), 5'-bisphosphate nucleotidase